jgi:biopolymer transport protein ExbD
VVIFLMLSTTFSKPSELPLRLPSAQGQVVPNRPKELVVSVSADGHYVLNSTPIGDGAAGLVPALAALSSPDAVLVISADGRASHQSVIHVMEAARQVGLSQVTFATQFTANNAVTPGSTRR